MNKALFCFALFFSVTSFAQDSQAIIDDTNNYSLDILFTNSEDFFDAYENSDDLDPIGSFFGNEQNTLTLSLNSPYEYYGTSSSGYYIAYNIKTFDFNKQDTTISGSDITEADLGTSVSGYNIYAYASMFFNFGDKFIITDNDSALKLGLGAGLGFLKADGTMILTERPGSPLINIDINDFGLSFGFFVDYRYGPWILRVETIGTEVKQDGIQFVYTTIPIQIGYSYKF